ATPCNPAHDRRDTPDAHALTTTSPCRAAGFDGALSTDSGTAHPSVPVPSRQHLLQLLPRVAQPVPFIRRVVGIRPCHTEDPFVLEPRPSRHLHRNTINRHVPQHFRRHEVVAHEHPRLGRRRPVT